MTGDLLVGVTGFVGSNLAAKHAFSQAVHSSDIESAFDGDWDLAVYAGVPSAMFMANSDPEADLAVMRQARENIRRIHAGKLVLISTIAVYADSRGKSELDEAGGVGLSVYGANRLQLEQWVREDIPDALIVRLPALYGRGLKKNFLFDLTHLAPTLLREDRYDELSASSDLVRASYGEPAEGFRRMRAGADREALERHFASSTFNALSFTDSRSRFQFYCLDHLMENIESALERGIELLNIATPPVSAGEVYRYIEGKDWENELDDAPFDYDMRSAHSPLSDGSPGYLCTRESELTSIRAFVDEVRS